MTPSTKIVLTIVGVALVGGVVAVTVGGGGGSTKGSTNGGKPSTGGGIVVPPGTSTPKPGAKVPGGLAPGVGAKPPPATDENWGYIPKGLIPFFQKAEQASGFAGLGRFAAVLAWARYRSGQHIVSDGDAYEFGLANPDLGRNTQFVLPVTVEESFQALERATLKKGEGPGEYGGYGAYANPRPRPKYYKEWGEIGEVGLYGWLGGKAAFAGYSEDEFMPFWDLHAKVLKEMSAQLFVLAYEVRELLMRTDLEIYRLSGTPPDPALLWPNVAQCLDDESGYLDGKKGFAEMFVSRAAECGIVLSQLQIPDLKKWPGGPLVYQAMGGPR